MGVTRSEAGVALAEPDIPLMLIVETDDHIRVELAERFGPSFRAHTADSVDQALRLWRATDPNLVVVDLSLGDRSGLEVLVEIRKTSRVPLILVSDDRRPETCVLALRFGADDFVPKPFDPSVLGARIEAVWRRSHGADANAKLVRAGNLVVDLDARQVYVDGDEVHLTPMEFDVLAHLATHPRQVLTRDQLMSMVWPSPMTWKSAPTVTEHVRRLRSKLGTAAEHVSTVYGRGYRFDL